MSATVLALSIVSILFALAAFTNWRRRRPAPELPLTPNCLLTKYPVVFVSPPLGPFYHSKPWHQLPADLAEHGYDVRILRLATASPTLRRQLLAQAARDLGAAHWIVDSWTEDAALPIELRTRAIVPQPVGRAPWFETLTLKLHRLSFIGRADLDARAMGADRETALDSLLTQVRTRAEDDWVDVGSHA